jgi:hypothetical protein
MAMAGQIRLQNKKVIIIIIDFLYCDPTWQTSSPLATLELTIINIPGLKLLFKKKYFLSEMCLML